MSYLIAGILENASAAVSKAGADIQSDVTARVKLIQQAFAPPGAVAPAQSAAAAAATPFQFKAGAALNVRPSTAQLLTAHEYITPSSSSTPMTTQSLAPPPSGPSTAVIVGGVAAVGLVLVLLKRKS